MQRIRRQTAYDAFKPVSLHISDKVRIEGIFTLHCECLDRCQVAREVLEEVGKGRIPLDFLSRVAQLDVEEPAHLTRDDLVTLHSSSLPQSGSKATHQSEPDQLSD